MKKENISQISEGGTNSDGKKGLVEGVWVLKRVTLSRLAEGEMGRMGAFRGGGPRTVWDITPLTFLQNWEMHKDMNEAIDL